MLEFEKKALLSAEAYALLRRSAVSEPQMQTNYYYDTENFCCTGWMSPAGSVKRRANASLRSSCTAKAPIAV